MLTVISSEDDESGIGKLAEEMAKEG